MANRTLRRNRTESAGNADNVSNGVVNDDGNEREPIGGTENDVERADRTVDGGAIESNSIGVSGHVEFDPNEYERTVIGNAAEPDNGNSDSNRTRRRRADAGQPRGARAARRATAQETIKPFVEMAHTWAAVLLKTPELAITSDESKQLSDAYETFCKYHNVPVMTAKRMSELQLIGPLGMVYGTRFVAIMDRKKAERAQRRAPIVSITGIQHNNNQAGD